MQHILSGNYSSIIIFLIQQQKRFAAVSAVYLDLCHQAI